MRALATLLLLLLPATALAQVYRWTDENGDVHYTDDAESIPPKYRKKAKTTKGQQLMELKVHKDEPKEEADAPKPPADGDVQVEAPREERKARTGKVEKQAAPEPQEDPNAEENRWRGLFRAAKDKVSRLEQDVEADRKLLEDPAYSGMAVNRDVQGNVRPNPQLERIKKRFEANEAALAQAKADLHDLEVKAANEAIPLEWRK